MPKGGQDQYDQLLAISKETTYGKYIVCREGLFLLPYNELAVAQGPKIYQKKAL